MGDTAAERSVAEHLRALCSRFPDRHVGGPGNRAANELFAGACAAHGLEVERRTFDCLDWEHGDAVIDVGGHAAELHPGPYSPPADLRAPLVGVSTVEELEALDAHGAILLLHSPVAAEQLTPLNYPFYRWDSHTRILEAIARANPAAVIGATGKDSGLTAALYPFPLFEDGDLPYPSAYLKDVDAELLLAHAGQTGHLRIDSRRFAASAEQVSARAAGESGRRVVVSAHIDSRHGTPGALDNGASVVALLELARLLGDGSEAPPHTVELVPFNGEDNYAAPGEVVYFTANEGQLGDIAFNVNMDAAGCAGQRTAVSFYGCPDELVSAVTRLVDAREGFILGEPWPMSDHSIFAMRGVPAIAITSENLLEIGSTIAHTAEDLPELVDPEIIVEIAKFLRELIDAV